MKSIDDVFFVHHARSGAFSDYEPGDVAYLTNGFTNNGVVGYVKPMPGDKVFKFRALVVSAFCEATIQMPPFIAYGAAGTSLTVLEPRADLTVGQLAFVAAYINQVHRWRFSWYRRSTPTRARKLTIPDETPEATLRIETVLPPLSNSTRPEWTAAFEPVRLDTIFDLVSGDHHSLSALLPGATPVVSCGEINNGIAGFFDVPSKHQNALTIALNGATLTAKYHPYPFAAKDDVAVCTPLKPLSLPALLFIQLMVNRERWRFSYYRKCYMNKLPRFEVPLPLKDGAIDKSLMKMLVTSAPYWKYIKSWTFEATG